MELTSAECEWRKSRASGNNGGNCVEVRAVETVDVRDSKDPNGPALTFTREDWQDFTASVKAGGFDLT